MKIKSLLTSATHRLQDDEAALDAKLLLQYVLNINHAWLISHAEDEVSAADDQRFQALLKRRINGEPIAYILGQREFYGLIFKTTPDTLIPRPDTETLVEAALAKLPKSQVCDILDLGTGTGAIALAIAHNRQQANVTAVDASEGALQVAKENAQNLALQNVAFALSNWFDALQKESFDIIVSNPPYIEDQDPHLSQGDLRFEPITALASGTDGLNDIRTIITQAPAHLKPNGWLMLEHGYNQAKQVAQLLTQAGFSQIKHQLDLTGIQRVTYAQL